MLTIFLKLILMVNTEIKAIQVTVQHQVQRKNSLTSSNKTLHYLLQNYFNFKIM